MRKTTVALGVATLLGMGLARAEPISASAYGDTSAGITDLATTGENTNARDMLSFFGSAAGPGLLSFGLRYNGSGAFLVRIAGASGNAIPTPEPASLFLIGAGLIGAAGVIRRQSRRRASATA